MSGVECLYFSALGWGDEEVRLVAAGTIPAPLACSRCCLDALPLSSPRLAELDVANCASVATRSGHERRANLHFELAWQPPSARGI